VRPRLIFGDHAEDEMPYLLGRLSSPNLPPGLGNQPPNKDENQLGASDHCFRADDDQGPLPTVPDSLSDYPEEPVEGAQARPRMKPLQHDKLLAYCQVFEEKTLTRTKEANHGSEAEPKESKLGQLYQERG
jgi:hypothetical protein